MLGGDERKEAKRLYSNPQSAYAGVNYLLHHYHPLLLRSGLCPLHVAGLCHLNSTTLWPCLSLNTTFLCATKATLMGHLI
jgi:hypothetical protein